MHRRTPDVDTFRAAAVRSLFNVSKLTAMGFDAAVEMPLEERPWRVGLIVGPSGSGKTSIGSAVWPELGVHQGYDWPADRPIVDAVADSGRSLDDVTGALASVGLGSVPSWLRPFPVLSNGEKFRAELARTVLEAPERIVLDEFTSVVDRQVARVGAAAFAKAWRRNPSGQAIALSCHYDIEEWLQPDWVVDTRDWLFRWRSVQRPPAVTLDLYEADWTRWWPLFEPHHYLILPRPAGVLYVGAVEGRPVVCCVVGTFPGLKLARMTRLVVLPEWQGAGVGLRFMSAVAERWRTGKNLYGIRVPTSIVTSHPGLCAALPRAGWRHISSRALGGGLPTSIRQTSGEAHGAYGGHLRATSSFRYDGPRGT